MTDITIAKLMPENANRVVGMLTDDGNNYANYFIPFASDVGSLEHRLKSARNDQYWGIWFGDKLAGFFMLRGFDEGYDRPSFGVFIGRQFSGCGLAGMALDYAISWCRLNGISSMMLKVHPDNKNAKHIYQKAGFRFIEVCSRTGHDVMEKTW